MTALSRNVEKARQLISNQPGVGLHSHPLGSPGIHVTEVTAAVLCQLLWQTVASGRAVSAAMLISTDCSCGTLWRIFLPL